MGIVVISGPPCAGKTYYAREHAGPGDMILDRDEMGGVAYERALSRLRAHGHRGGTAYVVACLPGPSVRAGFVSELRATNVHLTPPSDVLKARARARPNPKSAIAAIRAWQQREVVDTPRLGRNVDPPATVRSYWG